MTVPLAVLVLAAQVANAATPLSYGPAVVVLQGTVVVEDRFGPPNFGDDPQHDLRLKIAFLVLDRPIDVLTDPKQDVSKDSFHDVKRVQLLDGMNTRFLTMGGRHVVVQGKLEEESASGAYTHVLIEVTKVERID